MKLANEMIEHMEAEPCVAIAKFYKKEKKVINIDMSSSKAFIADVTKCFTHSDAYYRDRIGIKNMSKYKNIYDAVMAYETEKWKSRGYKPWCAYNGERPNTIKVIMEKIGVAKHCLSNLPKCKYCGKPVSVVGFDLETDDRIAPSGWIECECGNITNMGTYHWVDAVFYFLYKNVDRKDV